MLNFLKISSETDKICSKDCTYNIHSKSQFINHWGFLGCIVVITAITVAFFLSYNGSYKNTQNEILNLHRQYCQEFSKVATASDSIVVYKDFRPILDSHITSISDNLKLQYDKIQNDFVILTIWASVLMIIFLIFSIYSMYKVDEIQKQSRESLKLIDDTYSKVREKSDNLDTTMSGAMSRIECAINLKIDEFSQNIKTQSDELDKKIRDYKQSIEAAAADNQQLFDALVTILHSGIQPTVAKKEKKIHIKNKKVNIYVPEINVG